MTETERPELSVVQAEYRDVVPATNGHMPVEAGGWGRNLTPMNAQCEIPAWLGPDWKPDWKKLLAPTPTKYRKVMLNRDGSVRFRYATIEFYERRMAEAFDGCWGTELVHEAWGEPEKRSKGSGASKEDFVATPYTCVVQIVAAGLYRPLIGTGTSYMYSNNADDNEAKTRNAAFSAARKSAIRQLGVGRDTEPEDAEAAATDEAARKSIQSYWDGLVKRGKAVEAEKAISKIAKDAVTTQGKLLVEALDTEVLDDVRKALSDLAITTAKAAAEAKSAEAT